ncbi:hypothetical protein N7468_010309 [Penicillium chermesinum]|uniref:Anthranilate phosphoribosyltransferase n=1 Tax=Penicillium chermesinum TaxID=63820 RepID=A0A9W9NCF9_9EURO|nr:uncharacterized protein N7468_010309 [Penicillium chermesinum]KAJ5217301.1 hypothetical protein N7468_010309 [Penicillium chermesinum]
MAFPEEKPPVVSISPLLKRLAYPSTSDIRVSAEDIASAFALIFENRLSDIQTAALLTLLHSTEKDKQADVIALCSHRMREAACQIHKPSLKQVVKSRGRPEGDYKGGLCDIVGTGGDSHSTFNVSTTASIIASPLLMTAKHGNRAQTSFSGSADVLKAIQPVPPNIDAVNAENIARVYAETNYAFLFAPNFHPGMMYANPVRRALGLRTIFNLMGPPSKPLFADALVHAGAKKALVVCGEEDMDEISCAGPTNCWKISEYPNPDYVPDPDSKSNGYENNPDSDDDDSCCEDTIPPFKTKIETFQLQPSDFGLQRHPLSDVYGPSSATSSPPDDPILEFVLMNVAALLVTSGICEAETSQMGPGDDGNVIKERGPGGGRWKEGLRRARWAIESGQALSQLQSFIEVSNRL